MTGLKTNERPGTRAVLRNSHLSAFKARQVLDLIRGVDYLRASEILESADRGAAEVVGKVLHSAAANARHNDQLDPEELFVSACYADEGTTMKRWRPRARGRATRIRKRTCHITVIVARLPDNELARRRSRVVAEQAERRLRRVAGTRRARRQQADTAAEIAAEESVIAAEAIEEATELALESAAEVAGESVTEDSNEEEAPVSEVVEHSVEDRAATAETSATDEENE
jgi:large subunit ribosomal protein L22